MQREPQLPFRIVRSMNSSIRRPREFTFCKKKKSSDQAIRNSSYAQRRTPVPHTFKGVTNWSGILQAAKFTSQSKQRHCMFEGAVDLSTSATTSAKGQLPKGQRDTPELLGRWSASMSPNQEVQTLGARPMRAPLLPPHSAVSRRPSKNA